MQTNYSLIISSIAIFLSVLALWLNYKQFGTENKAKITSNFEIEYFRYANITSFPEGENVSGINSKFEITLSNKHKMDFVIHKIIVRFKYVYLLNEKPLWWKNLKDSIFHKDRMLFESSDPYISKTVFINGKRKSCDLPFILTNKKKIVISKQNIGILLSSSIEKTKDGQEVINKAEKFQIWMENNHGKRVCLTKWHFFNRWVRIIPRNKNKIYNRFL